MFDLNSEAKYARIVQLAAGADHTCALSVDGRVKCFGSNVHAQLTSRAALLTNVPFEPAAAVRVAGMQQICAGNDFTCAVRASDGVLLWYMLRSACGQFYLILF